AQVLPPATQTRSAASYFPANSLVPRMQRQPPSQVGVRDPALPTAFFLMLSVGPDAAVVHRLAAARTGAIGHWSYLRPILSEMLAPTLRPLTVHADGSRLFHARTGLLVIANSPQYGVRINPAARASISDGLLDIVFFPAESAAELVVWAARARLRSHLRSRRLLYHTAREVTLHCDDGAAPYQLDGEAGRYIDSPSQPLTIRLRPAALKVLDAATPGAT
ncbi:MAG: diacylglycerol kinase family protein, partial [Phycisphaerales bacterium]